MWIEYLLGFDAVLAWRVEFVDEFTYYLKSGIPWPANLHIINTIIFVAFSSTFYPIGFKYVLAIYGEYCLPKGVVS